jgi:hypothetical protein
MLRQLMIKIENRSFGGLALKLLVSMDRGAPEIVSKYVGGCVEE